MTEIIGVRFKSGGKQYYFDPRGLEVKNGQGVIVETGKGLEFGTCVRPNGFVNDDAVVQPLRPVVRVATDKDLKQLADNRAKEERAMKLCQQQVAAHKLDMKLVDVEYSFDGSKIIFFFTSEGRVDFRSLVKDLAGIFRSRIELRQIGVRDEARMLGGLGICGRPFCCSQFLDEFQPVSIKMAKTQNLSLNPTKISGTCGRLMCCLKYEQDAYEDAMKRCPKQESFVECPDGVGTVSAVDLLRERVKVRLEDSSEQPQSYRTSEIRVIRSGKGKRPEDYVAPPKEELEKLRYIDPDADPAARRLGEAARLSAALEQYLGSSEPDQGEDEEKRSGRRRRRRGKKPAEGQPAPPAAQESRPAEPRKKEGKGQSAGKGSRPPRGGKKPAAEGQSAPESRPSAPAPAAQQKEGGEGARRRRRRPHHRRGGKKPGEGGAAQSQ